MSSPSIAETPLGTFNGNSLNDSSNEDSSECMDLSIKECFLITYHHGSDPGKEYEIWSQKDLVDTWVIVATGVSVTVQLGNAKLQGVVLAVSDDRDYLESNFRRITQEHQEEIISKSKKKGHSRNRNRIVEDRITKCEDKETQTDITGTDAANYDDYQDLQKKYDDLKFEVEKYRTLFSDVKMDLDDTVAKLQSINNGTKNGNISSTPSSHKKKAVLKPLDNLPEEVDCFNKMIQIGSSGSKIPKTVYDSINWNSHTAATRKLLITLFSRKVLATHSLTGKPSPAFLTCDKQKKFRLDSAIIADIVEVVSKKCKVTESSVRNVITTKCADENKMYRKRLQRRKDNGTENGTDENEEPTTV